jgi:hypothetical protein
MEKGYSIAGRSPRGISRKNEAQETKRDQGQPGYVLIQLARPSHALRFRHETFLERQGEAEKSVSLSRSPLSRYVESHSLAVPGQANCKQRTDSYECLREPDCPQFV